MAEEAQDVELRLLARRLFEEGGRMMRLKPREDVRDSMRGVPAVMRELLRQDEPLSPGELARRVHVSDARIANVLRMLEGRGYIERQQAVDDRRRVEVRITERGRAVASERAAEMERTIIGVLSDLGVEDARDLVRVLGRLNDVIEARGPFSDGPAFHGDLIEKEAQA